MIELGKTQCLNIVKKTDFGVYLGTETEKILLPKKDVPEDVEIGDALTVFVYRDSDDRLIATTRDPAVHLGELAVLKVLQVTKIGAFLDWGLEKDLFLPFKEQTEHVREGQQILIALYIDKSDRLAATMHVYNYLTCDSSYVKDSAVTGTVIGINPEMGIYLAVDNKYFGMIPRSEAVGSDLLDTLHIGDVVNGRVAEVREDQKLTISLRQKAYIQMDEDALTVYQALEEAGGKLPFGDKSDAQEIRDRFHLSKNAFKRALGHLLKEGKITVSENSIEKQS